MIEIMILQGEKITTKMSEKIINKSNKTKSQITTPNVFRCHLRFQFWGKDEEKDHFGGYFLAQ